LRYRYPPNEYPHFNAAYGQYYYLHPGQSVFKIPENVPDDLAGPANCALSQVIYAFERGRVGIGDHVVIQGAGGLGINAVAVARERGVTQIIVIDAIAERLELAKEFGADVTLHLPEYPAAEDRIRKVRQLTDGQGADAVLEVAGLPQVIPEGIAMLCQGGTYLEVGNINQNRKVEIDPSQLVHGSKSLLGIMWYDPQSLRQALDLLSTRADRYPFHKILSHHYPLRGINEAFHDQDSGAVQRAALLPWSD
jgi:threonine dehydrogenase-like Zn-dependent dehydrogenase